MPMMAITHAAIAPLEELQQAYPDADIFLKLEFNSVNVMYKFFSDSVFSYQHFSFCTYTN